MTPKQLRQKALSKISSAQALLAAGQYDEASYVVGYAAELALKARYCTRKGWSDFPDDRAEVKRRGAADVMIHDLDELLNLAGHASLQTNSMLHIDWGRALDWSEQQRYHPVGSVVPEQAKAQVEETRKLCGELALYEIVEKLLVVEIEVSNLYGPFNFFALVERATQNQGWEVMMSAWWILGDGKAKGDAVVKKTRAILDDDLYALIRRFVSFHPLDERIQMFHHFAFGGQVHHPRLVTSGNIVDGNPLPPAFIITNVEYRSPQP
jgi:hypothetical protein